MKILQCKTIWTRSIPCSQYMISEDFMSRKLYLLGPDTMQPQTVTVQIEGCEQLKDEPRGMGFCHIYWSTKRAALARRGIEWRSPSAMNPRVMFD